MVLRCWMPGSNICQPTSSQMTYILPAGSQPGFGVPASCEGAQLGPNPLPSPSVRVWGWPAGRVRASPGGRLGPRLPNWESRCPGQGVGGAASLPQSGDVSAIMSDAGAICRLRPNYGWVSLSLYIFQGWGFRVYLFLYVWKPVDEGFCDLKCQKAADAQTQINFK